MPSKLAIAPDTLIEDYLEDKDELIATNDNYFIFYRTYSKYVKKTYGRPGNLYLAVRQETYISGYGYTRYIVYSDKEWPRVKTITPSIKAEAKKYQDFFDLQAKIT